MDYKKKFSTYVEENKLEDARVLLEQFRTSAFEDSFYFANMGWLLNHQERYIEAEIILRKGLLYYPDDSWMYSQLGFALNRQGKPKDGLDSLNRALELGFDEPWLHGEIGWSYKELDDYKKAIENFENGLLDDDKNTWLLSQAAYMYMALDDMQIAEEYFLKSFHLQKDIDAICDLIYFYKAQKDYRKVIEFLHDEQLHELEEYRQYEYGNAYYEQKQYNEAIEHLLKVLELGRDDTTVRAQLADAYMNLGKVEAANEQYDIALNYYEKALQKEHDQYWIYQEMIWIAHKQCNYEKKLKYLKRASQIVNDNVWLQFHYARTYSDLNMHEEAISACRYCLKHGDQSQELYDLIAWNLGQCNKEEEAISYLIKCIDTYGGSEWKYGELGWNYAKQKEYDKAIEYYMQALKLHENALYASMLAWCYLRKNIFDTALSYIQQACSLGRDDDWIHTVTAEIYTGLKEYILAIEHYKKAIAYGYDEEWVHKEIDHLIALHNGEEIGEDKD